VSNYKEIVADVLSSLQDVGANTSINFHFLHKRSGSVRTSMKWKYAIERDGMPPC